MSTTYPDPHHEFRTPSNVLVIEAEQVVNSLEARGVPVEYVLFRDEGHGWRRTPNRIRSTVAIVQWFDTHLNQR